MDSRSAYEPLENNMQLITVSRPSTGSASESADQNSVKNAGDGVGEGMEFRGIETIEEFFRPELAK